MTSTLSLVRRCARHSAAFVLLGALPVAQAATLHVTSLADSGAGSLRATVAAAASGDLILFDVTGTIPLQSEISINKDLSIENTQAGAVQISGGGGTWSLFRVGNNRAVALTRLSLLNATNAVQNQGSLTLTRVLVRGNAGSMGAGVTGCVDPATQSLNVFNSTFIGNAAVNGGGAIAACGQINVSGSTFAGNTAVYGGAIAVVNTGSVGISNSTFQGNVASSFGGAIATDYSGMTLANVTFSGNRSSTTNGSALHMGGGAVPVVNNSLFANGVGGPHCMGGVLGGHNLNFGDPAGANSCGASVTVTADPLLGGLADNGGWTPTMALGANSPAIDTGAAAGAPGTDQRGIARPQGAGYDIGAYEAEQVVKHFEGPSATGTGIVKADLAGGGATCSFSAPALLAAAPGATPANPPGYTFPHGLFEFTAQKCDAGGTITLTLTYPAALAAGAKYFKWGPTPGNLTAHWYELPAQINGNTATFSIIDGGLGDDDLAANGVIVDQGGPGVPGGAPGAGVTGVPTLDQWALWLLSLFAAGAGVRQLTRRRGG